MEHNISWAIEYVTFVVMLGFSVIIGLYYGFFSKQDTIDDFLLGGKRMSVFPIAMSLIVCHVSGITLLGVPAEVYTHGTEYLMTGAVNVIIVMITIYIFLPVFYELQLSSVYEYLELRFDSKVRRVCSLIFTMSRFLYEPLVIYIPALALNQVTGINEIVITAVMCAICIFYTTIGGLRAVVWTDTIQSVFMLISLVIVFVLGCKQAGGIGNVFRTSREGGRIELFNMNPNPFLRNTFWTVNLGTICTWLPSIAIHPAAVQRYVALPSYNKARIALIIFVFGVASITFLCGFNGLLIYSSYKDCDPITSNHVPSDKNLLPFYIMNVAANCPGLIGLFVSGVISSALSTTSAHLHIISGTIYEDFIVKITGVRFSDLTASIIMKCTVVIMGTICVALVLVVEKLKGLVQIAVSLSGITCGPLLAVFTLGVCFPRANSRGALCGLITSLVVMIWIFTGAQMAIYNNQLKFVEKDVSVAGCPAGTVFKNSTDFSGLYRMNEDVWVGPDVWKIYTVSYMLYSFIGFVVGVCTGMAVSLLFPTGLTVDPKLLTPFVRKSVSIRHVTLSGPNATEPEQYKLAKL